MIKNLFFQGLLDTGKVDNQIMVIKDWFVNFYIIKTSNNLVCIDTGWRPFHVMRSFNQLSLDIHDVNAVFITHFHWDHCRCVNQYKNAKVYIGVNETNEKFENKLKHTQTLIKVKDGDVVEFENLSVKVLETPGHTSNSVCYLIDDKFLFTGDTLRIKDNKILPFLSIFNKNRQVLKNSINKINTFKNIECIFTAHNGKFELK
ncbi:MAG: metallO-beta-lactamase family protein [uncultured bacterium]|nr:MAG: metallO-beta-lactamase family protein [uncultured bacterium]